MTPIGPLTPDRLARIVALNNADAEALSPLDADRLGHLLDQAFWTARVGDVDGFVLTFDETANYDSPNYRWFRARHDRFVYIDRVVVAAAARGRGHARQLYQGVLTAAIAAGHTTIAAEVNCVPPNPASDAFHAAFGFQEAGRAAIHGGAKTVRYLARAVA
ncbi:MAG: GNAT family N-acetyltransferase [Gemmatimonadaceae bacterium]|nr:GNAT family N-acetyltransferase [Acetobacteraceae bacterium]